MKTEWTREAVEERRQRRLAEFRQRCVEGYAEGYPARLERSAVSPFVRRALANELPAKALGR